MPKGIYPRYPRLPGRDKPVAKPVPKKVSQMKRKAVLTRWESVKEEINDWLKPFYELPTDQAMAYLEDLRKICESAGRIMNERINKVNSPIKCAGPRCGRDLTGTNPNGKPKWISKKDFRDEKHPEIIHSLYYCSEICVNGWTHAHLGAAGTAGG